MFSGTPTPASEIRAAFFYRIFPRFSAPKKYASKILKKVPLNQLYSFNSSDKYWDGAWGIILTAFPVTKTQTNQQLLISNSAWSFFNDELDTC